MTRTTKSERKYGKKNPSDIQDKPKPRKGSSKSKKKIELYKILIEGCAFSKAMSYEDCQKEIARYEAEAEKLNQNKPSLVLVKQ